MQEFEKKIKSFFLCDEKHNLIGKWDIMDHTEAGISFLNKLNFMSNITEKHEQSHWIEHLMHDRLKDTD